jgi:hypothetical protein
MAKMGWCVNGHVAAGPDKFVLISNWEGSDIDIVAISDDFKYKSYWERIDILSDVIYEICCVLRNMQYDVSYD